MINISRRINVKSTKLKVKQEEDAEKKARRK